MRVLVDSDVLIDILRGVPAARGVVSAARVRGDSLFSVTPVRTEILRGVAQHDLRAAGELLGVLGWLDVDIALADRAAAIGRPYQRSSTCSLRPRWTAWMGSFSPETFGTFRCSRGSARPTDGPASRMAECYRGDIITPYPAGGHIRQ
jgi:predicted nucleic acid-binding protein